MNDVQEVVATETIVRALVRIVYKSGFVYEAWFDKMEVQEKDGKIVSMSWKPSPSNQDRILSIGVESIESIVQLDAVAVEVPVEVVAE